jgi:CrcB protein
MSNLIYVALGGALGAMGRYLVGVWLHQPEPVMPWGTLAANLIGCLLIGFGFHFVENSSWSAHGQLLVMTGFIGSFTTFSTFSLETMTLIQYGKYGTAVAYVGLSLVAGLTLVALGYWTSGRLF